MPARGGAGPTAAITAAWASAAPPVSWLDKPLEDEASSVVNLTIKNGWAAALPPPSPPPQLPIAGGLESHAAPSAAPFLAGTRGATLDGGDDGSAGCGDGDDAGERRRTSVAASSILTTVATTAGVPALPEVPLVDVAAVVGVSSIADATASEAPAERNSAGDIGVATTAPPSDVGTTVVLKTPRVSFGRGGPGLGGTGGIGGCSGGRGVAGGASAAGLTPSAPSPQPSPSSTSRGSRHQAISQVPPPARLLSIGGREGIGQRINGDYELLEGVEMNSRPCWLRRARFDCLGPASEVWPFEAIAHVGVAGATPAGEAGDPEGIDERPLYLFMGEMGYWTIAPSLHATGVQVLARNGPDFSVASPDQAPSYWVVFAHGKAKPDPSVVCFRHHSLLPRPEILHVSGCKGPAHQFNGLYYHVSGVIVGSRPVFIKDGLKGSPKEEKRLIHFSQRAGRWLLSSAVATPCPLTRGDRRSSAVAEAAVLKDGAVPAAPADGIAGNGRGDVRREQPSVEWRDMTILARSPVAWTSMSPIHLLPKEPWSVRVDLPPRILRNSPRIVRVLDSQRLPHDRRGDPPASFEPYPALRVAHWTGSPTKYSPTPCSPCSPRSPRSPRSLLSQSLGFSDIDEVESPVSFDRIVASHGVVRDLLCVNLESPQGLCDAYGINGDYARSPETYAERPIYVKLPVVRGGRPPSPVAGQEGPSEKRLYLFFDDMTGRWHLAPEVGFACNAVARSQVDWNALKPPLSALWQLRVPALVAAVGAQLGLQTLASTLAEGADEGLFRDWEDLCVSTIPYGGSLPRTVMFGGETLAQGLCDHALSGDFRLMCERYGRRPIYKRAAQVPTGSPSLWLFFEPRSGYWVISSGSPLAAPPEQQDVGAAGLFGEVYARSGPAWNAFTPEAPSKWEIFDQDIERSHKRAPDSLLSPILKAVPSLRLHVPTAEAPPRWLYVGGFGSHGGRCGIRALNGTYELLDETQWSSRPAWRFVDGHKYGAEADKFAKYIFFWAETGYWIIGHNLHVTVSALARSGPGRWAAETPDRSTGRWESLNGRVFEDDAHVFVRRQRTAGGGILTPGVSLAGSPRSSSRWCATPRNSLCGGGGGGCGLVTSAAPSEARSEQQRQPLGAGSAGRGGYVSVSQRRSPSPQQRERARSPGRPMSPCRLPPQPVAPRTGATSWRAPSASRSPRHEEDRDRHCEVQTPRGRNGGGAWEYPTEGNDVIIQTASDPVPESAPGSSQLKGVRDAVAVATAAAAAVAAASFASEAGALHPPPPSSHQTPREGQQAASESADDTNGMRRQHSPKLRPRAASTADLATAAGTAAGHQARSPTMSRPSLGTSSSTTALAARLMRKG